jgi:hypothetical protein
MTKTQRQIAPKTQILKGQTTQNQHVFIIINEQHDNNLKSIPMQCYGDIHSTAILPFFPLLLKKLF